MSWRLSTRSDPRPGRPGLRWWVSAGVMAAAAFVAAYFLDPQRGEARRSRLVQRTRALVPGNPLRAGWPDFGPSGGWPDEPPPDVDSED